MQSITVNNPGRKRTLIVFALLMLLAGYAQAQLNVTVSGVNAICAADASIKASTTGGTAPYTFTLLDASNVVVKPAQTDSLFTNLAPGTYKVAVLDAVNTVTPVVSATKAVTSAYVPMSVSSAQGSTSPLAYSCTPGTNAGSFYISYTGGTAPYTIDVQAGTTIPAPIVTNNRAANITGLASGTYRVSVTDACGNQVSTNTVSLYGVASVYPAAILNMVNSVSFYTQASVGTCGPRAMLSTPNGAGIIKWLMEYPTGSGNYTDTATNGTFQQLPYYNPSSLQGKSYTLYVQHPCTGVWESKAVALPNFSNLFTPGIDGNSNLYVNNNCDSIIPRIQPNFFGSSAEAVKFYCYPVRLTITDSVNAAVKVLDTLISAIGGGTYYDSYAVPASGVYWVILTDAQGSVYRKTVKVVASAPRKISVGAANITGCDASNASLYAYGIAPGNVFPVTINLISAPGVTDLSAYPPVVVNSTTATNQVIYLWNNLPAANGTAKFEVVWSCRKDTSSVAISKFRYTSAKLDSTSLRIGAAGCSGGKADIMVNAHLVDTSGNVTVLRSNNAGSYTMLMRILPNQQTAYLNGTPNQMVFTNLTPGTYKIGIAPNIESFNTYSGPVDCPYWDTLTVVVPDFKAPVIDANKTYGMVCIGETGNGKLLVTVKGYPPFLYRIKPSVSGTYGAYQSANLFTGLDAGSYDVQVQDGCNAVTTQTVSVQSAGSAAFITVTGAPGNMAPVNGKVTLSFTAIGGYSNVVWTKPDGTIVNGADLSLAVFQRTDTGLYKVSAVSDLGCLLTTSVKIGYGNIALPLTLVSFGGERSDANDVLRWVAANEVQSDYFVVEYASDAKRFAAISTVNNTGTDASAQHYEFTHTGVTGAAWYRLKMVDKDGTYAYSKVIKLDGAGGCDGNGFTINEVYPVPFRETLNVGYCLGVATEMTVRLFNIQGMEVFRTRMFLEKGQGVMQLNLPSNLPGGAYVLDFTSHEGTRQMVKIMK